MAYWNKKGESEKELENVSIFGVIQWAFHFLTKVFLYSVFVIFLCIIAIFIVYFGDQVINIGKNQDPLLNAYVIVSPSMDPTIKVNDAVLVKRKTVKQLKKGDIISYISTDPRYSGLTVTHRIVKIQKSEENKILFTTKGDNNNTIDSTYVTEDNLIGKVIFKIPKVGYLQSFLLNIYGWVILIVLPCVGVIIYDIIKLFRSIAIKDDRKGKKQKNTKVKKEKPIEVIGDEKKESEEVVEVLSLDESVPKIEEEIEVLEEDD